MLADRFEHLDWCRLREARCLRLAARRREDWARRLGVAAWVLIPISLLLLPAALDAQAKLPVPLMWDWGCLSPTDVNRLSILEAAWSERLTSAFSGSFVLLLLVIAVRRGTDTIVRRARWLLHEAERLENEHAQLHGAIDAPRESPEPRQRAKTVR